MQRRNAAWLHFASMDIANLLYVTGVFAVILGGLHFFSPVLFDYD